MNQGTLWMSKYLDPKTDVVFKKVFGDHPDLLISFLNALLPLEPGHEIVELEYLPQEQVPPIPTMKRTIADVRCRDQQGRIFIVEMQINWNDSFKQRLLFESGQAIVSQLEKGEEYHLLRPVYGLGLIANNFDPDPEHWYHHYQLVNVMKPKREVIEHLQLVFIELQKLPIQSRQTKRLQILWLRFMREIDRTTQTIDPELLTIPEIKRAVKLAETAAYNPGELNAYEMYWDQIRRENTLLSGREMKGRAEGLKAGLAKGLEEGRTQGLEEGRMQERIHIAKALLLKNISIETIAEITGLTAYEITTL